MLLREACAHLLLWYRTAPELEDLMVLEGQAKVGFAGGALLTMYVDSEDRLVCDWKPHSLIVRFDSITTNFNIDVAIMARKVLQGGL